MLFKWRFLGNGEWNKKMVNVKKMRQVFTEKERRRLNGDYKKLLPLLRMGRLESLAGCNN
jgi:hypothetical protein